MPFGRDLRRIVIMLRKIDPSVTTWSRRMRSSREFHISGGVGERTWDFVLGVQVLKVPVPKPVGTESRF